jgi:hypothetical protein
MVVKPSAAWSVALVAIARRHRRSHGDPVPEAAEGIEVAPSLGLASGEGSDQANLLDG